MNDALRHGLNTIYNGITRGDRGYVLEGVRDVLAAEQPLSAVTQQHLVDLLTGISSNSDDEGRRQ